MEKQWTINYIPEGGRLTGHLVVRDDEVTFKALYDSSFKTVAKKVGIAVGALGASGGALTYVRDNGAEAEIVIPSASISHAVEAKKGMMKRVVVILNDGTDYTFEYGLLGVKKLVAAVNDVAAAA